MRPWPVSLLLFALAACSPRASDSSAQAQCERQVGDDPKVDEIYSRTNGWYTYPYQTHDELVMAQRQATIRCLREKGLVPPGGVQAVKPQY